ncbi:MAG TPA: hypothetical protein PK619_00300 [bacterium]|nr:hypothetical protein [bacterium]HPW39153.1 hypothetical protein [bacterium]
MPETEETPLATGEQVEHIMDMWRRRLKNRELTREEAQIIITGGNRYLPVMDAAADMMVDRVRTEMFNTIVRTVRNIKRNQTVRQAIDATGRNQYGDDKLLATMPWGEGPEEVELVYVRAGKQLSPVEQERFLAEHDLIPDPQAQMADNEQNPGFADKYRNGLQWNRDRDLISFVIFSQGIEVGRIVYVDRFRRDWLGHWWFAGVRKPKAGK